MNKIKSNLLTGFLFGTLIGFSTVQASSYYAPGYGNQNKDVKHACKERIRENVWSDHQYIQKVRFTRGSFDVWKDSQAKSVMKGKGEFLNRNGRWKTFDFKCVYSHRQDRVVSSSYRKISNDWNGGQDWNKPGHGNNNGRQACKHEIDRKVLRQHESASRIRWNDRSVKKWSKPRGEIGFQGKGQFVGGRNRTRYFEFQCSYNPRYDDVTSSWVNVQR